MYPPEHHVETDKEKIYRVIENFSFATLISNTENDVLVTQLPLILNRHEGEKGLLVGHMDKNNPHAKYLDNEKVVAIFHGPDAYISPNVYASSQLPTWNSISVHVRGTIRLNTSVKSVKQSLIDMTSYLEPDSDGYVLKPDDERIEALIHYVVGFTIEIEEMIGRFKLSQDKNEEDTQLAKKHLISENRKVDKKLIDFLL